MANKTRELSRLEQLEQIVERGLDQTIAVWAALKEIHDAGLYKPSYGSWEAYCRGRWGFSRQRGYQLIRAFEVTTAVDGKLTENQARPLANQPPQVQRQAVAQAQEKGKVTGPALEEEVAAINREEDERRRNAPPAERGPRRSSRGAAKERLEQIERVVARLKRLHAGLTDVADDGDAMLDAYLAKMQTTSEE